MIELSGAKRSSRAIARPDDSSLRLEVGEADESDRGIFGGMFEPMASLCPCLPSLRPGSKGSADESDGSMIELEPLSRNASMYTREKSKMPPKRTQWWQVTLYIINDTIGAWLILYSSVVLGMYGWIMGMLILVS